MAKEATPPLPLVKLCARDPDKPLSSFNFMITINGVECPARRVEITPLDCANPSYAEVKITLPANLSIEGQMVFTRVTRMDPK